MHGARVRTPATRSVFGIDPPGQPAPPWTTREWFGIGDALQLADLRGKVVVFDLKTAGITRLAPLPDKFSGWREMEIFSNGKAMRLARWPNTGWAEIARVNAPTVAQRFQMSQPKPPS